MLDVIVVGGGPVGLHTAGLCKRMGYKVAVLEEDASIGEPLRCSGLISRNVTKFFPDIEKWGVVENVIDYAVLHSRKSDLTLRKTKAAYVIDRSLFDKKIAEQSGCEIKFGCRAGKINVRDDHVEIITNKGDVKGEMAIICDGPNSMLSKKRKVVKGLIAIVKGENHAKNVDLCFNKSLLHDGFFWKIPRGKTTEYGAWGSTVKFTDIEKFFGIKKYEKFAGLIPIGPVKKSYSERILMAGSSAGQVKPWSGGGVIYGLTCAEIAAKTIEKAFKCNDFSEFVLKQYETAWQKKIGRQIKMGLIFRKFLEHSNDFQLDAALRTGKIMNYSWMDMDFIV
jgi:flavin-dependent dehydrogenase